jgi:large subunit ribosomal protein L10
MGRVDGEAVTAAHVKRLGEIPPRDVLLAQMAGAMNSVLYTMVGALEALREQRSAAAS